MDFLARDASGGQELIPVCADLTDPATAQRELRALEEAARAFPAAERRLLTLTSDSMPAEIPGGVTVQPAYEWLLTLPGEA